MNKHLLRLWHNANKHPLTSTAGSAFLVLAVYYAVVGNVEAAISLATTALILLGSRDQGKTLDLTEDDLTADGDHGR
jgi:hypothetical protein